MYCKHYCLYYMSHVNGCSTMQYLLHWNVLRMNGAEPSNIWQRRKVQIYPFERILLLLITVFGISLGRNPHILTKISRLYIHFGLFFKIYSPTFATEDPTSEITGHDTEFPEKCKQRTIEKNKQFIRLTMIILKYTKWIGEPCSLIS